LSRNELLLLLLLLLQQFLLMLLLHLYQLVYRSLELIGSDLTIGKEGLQLLERGYLACWRGLLLIHSRRRR